jgi:hypothetical protein
MFYDVNWFSVFTAGVAAMIVGYAWYSPALFGKAWMAESGLTSEKMAEGQKKPMGMIYFGSFIGTLVMAWVLSIVLNNLFVLSIQEALHYTLLLWFGLVATVKLNDSFFGDQSFKLFCINAGHTLVALIIMALIVTWWQ